MSGEATSRDGVGGLTWGFALLGGLVAWFVRLVVGVGMVGWACTAGTIGHLAFLGLMVVTGAVAVVSLVMAWRLRQRSESLHVVAVLGVLLNLVALAGIVFETGASLFIDPCSSAL